MLRLRVFSFGFTDMNVVAVPLSETSDLLLYFVVTMQKEFKEFF